MNILVDGQVFNSPEVNRGIGVYSRNVLINMIRNNNNDDNWFIAIDNRKSLECLPNDIKCRLITVIDNVFEATSDFNRTEIYTRELEKIVSRYSIDIYWNPDPLMVNVLFPARRLQCKMFLMLHDMIPYIRPVKEWSKEVNSEYIRRLEFIREKDIVGLCNSNSTANDFHQHLSQDIHTVVTPLAADSDIFYRESNRDISNPYIVFTGGFDYRKNIYAAVDAYQLALDKSDDMANTKFLLVCKCSDEQKKEFYARIKPKNKDKVILTGFITDEELAALYAKASVFFFPSLYEGFGLPIVEAMLGGAYILSADNSSLPEVCGEHALFCNAENVEDMSDKLVEAYEASKLEPQNSRIARQKYALKFSWKRTANMTYAAFLDNVGERNYKVRFKVAFVTPWPTMQTGIATYVYKLIPALTKYFDIDIFADNTQANDALSENKYGALYNICELPYRYKDYDKVIYQIGNNTKFHKGIYEYFRTIGGIAEIHDFDVSPFFYHSFYLNGKKDIYKEALVNGYGVNGEERFEYLEQGNPDDGLFKMNSSVASIAQATIYHNAWSIIQPSKSKRDYLIPLASFKEFGGINEEFMNSTKAHAGIHSEDLIIGMLGFINDNKRYSVLLKSFKLLKERVPNVKLIFWGKEASEDIFDLINRYELNDSAFVMGYLKDDEYYTGLSMSDIIVNLRYPSMGESSATLTEAFNHGKPVIVSAINQYLEFPDEICWKLPVYDNQDYEAEHLEWMLEALCANEQLRNQLGENAMNYAELQLSQDVIARKYYDIIAREKNR